MRLLLRDESWTLSPAHRAVARDRIRLALGRHAPSVSSLRAYFKRVGQGGTAGRLVLSASLADGRRLSVESELPNADVERFERFVDRQALRLARAIERGAVAKVTGEPRSESEVG